MEELERRLERPSSEARPLRGPSPLGAGPGEVPGHSPSPYSPECVEGKFSELRQNGVLRSSRLQSPTFSSGPVAIEPPSDLFGPKTGPW